MESRKVRARFCASMVSFVLLLPASALAAPSVTADRRVAAEAAFAEVTRERPHTRAVWRVGQPGPTVVTGLSLRVSGVTAEQQAKTFVAEHEDLVGVSAADLTVVDVRRSRHVVSVQLKQRHGAHDVVGREVVVSLDGAGKVLAFTSSAAPLTEVVDARIDEREALVVARKALDNLVVTEKATQVVVASGERGAPALAFLASRPENLRAFRVLVDLNEGAVVGVEELTKR
jgi:Zn-dependent metalloprotease